MQQSGPCLLAAVAAAGLHAGPALAASYDFVPAPQADLNRMYRIDKATGEVISCQYYLQEGTIGVTLCFGPGEGAGAQAAGEYGLVPSRHTKEAGVFRVNYRSGEMSVCYVLEDKVVCTPQAGPEATAPQAAGAPPSAPATPGPAGPRAPGRP
ncbi:MAG TPA: hypothetical protein VE443_12390 [Beijerinckiaceae bacterium]|nr:hypothetical protein [Beijerinckiaceae bacterium]